MLVFIFTLKKKNIQKIFEVRLHFGVIFTKNVHALPLSKVSNSQLIPLKVF